jgi:hypothetical protein|tara:strand:- start:663 stop:1025 length:363 start_codon:yes stop_codon:yes gene_type:complete
MKNRKDYGEKADKWFTTLDEQLIPIASELRILIKGAISEIVESIKWGMPTYEKNGYICALRAGKGYIALQFGSIGVALDDPDSLLEGSGKKMRHVKIWSKKEIKKQLYKSWIKRAANENN